jgi:pyridoxine 5-phosphate synthase
LNTYYRCAREEIGYTNHHFAVFQEDRVLLGVNIDHIAVLREARKVNDPDPLDALGICKHAGVDQITIHLREDRRHIQDHDAEHIVRLSPLPVNLECAIAPEMIEIACHLRPHRVTLVPEKREEITTEGGLSILGKEPRLLEAIERLHASQIEVSLFIDPDFDAISTAKMLGVEWVELHTGTYANLHAMLHTNLSRTHHTVPGLDLARTQLRQDLENNLHDLRMLSCDAMEMGLRVAAGHGLNLRNLDPIVEIGSIEELNIGQSIIAQALFVGLERAILNIKAKMIRG